MDNSDNQKLLALLQIKLRGASLLQHELFSRSWVTQSCCSCHKMGSLLPAEM